MWWGSEEWICEELEEEGEYDQHTLYEILNWESEWESKADSNKKETEVRFGHLNKEKNQNWFQE